MAALILDEGVLKQMAEVERLISILEYSEANLDAPLEEKKSGETVMSLRVSFCGFISHRVGLSQLITCAKSSYSAARVCCSTNSTVVEIANCAASEASFISAGFSKRASAPAPLLIAHKESRGCNNRLHNT
jgi:hypothetical protein